MKNFEITCGDCKSKLMPKDLIENLSKASNGMFQIRGECPKCQRWIKWVPYAESHLVKDILSAFYELDQEAFHRLHSTAIIDHKDKIII